MSGTWDAVIRDEEHMHQIREDHGRTQAAYESRRWHRVKHRLGVSWKQGYRSGFWDAVEWVLHLQRRVDDLTAEEIVGELRKGPGSVYYPLWELDPKVWVECPSGVSHNAGARVLVDAEGYCDTCGYDFVSSARVAPPKDHKEN